MSKVFNVFNTATGRLVKVRTHFGGTYEFNISKNAFSIFNTKKKQGNGDANWVSRRAEIHYKLSKRTPWTDYERRKRFTAFGNQCK